LIGGGGNDTLTGDAGDDTLDGGAGADEFNPGAGNDVYVIDNVGDKIQPLLDDGVDTVEGTITFTLINQENLTLKGAAAINGTGNENSNVITGNAAANVLNGMSGVDTLIGGAGNDTYIADASSEKITELVNQGTDLVKSSASFTLPDHVENLTLTEADSVTGTGNTLNNLIAGNIGNNQLDGDGGNDTLSGGDGNDTLDGGAGNDSMAGGLGDDRYIVDSTTDRVTETSTAAGKDRVRSFESFTLGAYVEELELTGGKSINGTGNTLDNLLIGNAFANVLDGKTGADDMRGGAGDDVYVQDNLGDQMNEEGNTDSGDELRTNQAHSNALPGIEHYTFTGAKAIDFLADGAANRISGTALADTLDGLGEDDTLVGGSGNDLLVGDAAHDSLDGGAGADTMDGDEGNDTYVIDSASDKIVGGLDGSDTVRSSITYVLLAGLEHLVLIGAAAINGIGTSLDNQLTGNDSANVLDGGTGDDTMAGNKGNDTYKVDSSADQVIEVDNGGTDTVLSDKNYVLFDKNVENLTLLGTALAATGNESKNRLTGNDQNNQLDGAAGADTLVGGKGNDIYRVDVAQDIVTESSTLSTEIDTVQSTAPSYVLPAYVENLILLEGAGNGTGNTLANTITGNSGPNSLAGSAGNDVLAGNGGNDTLDGGTGTDTLEGGPGNDLYVQDSALDEIDEETSTDPGDELKTNQTLSNSSERPGIEHYTFTGSKAIDFDADDAANRITGTALADTLDGGAGNDTLSGGAGADSLVGGLGNDTYVVDNANDRLRDDVGVGIDTVQSSVSFDLTDDNPGPAGTVFGTLENLTLVGAGAISGTGNDAANVIIGNGAANTITGRGGNDTIDGGAGNDTIRYTSALDGHDVIDNFDANPAGGQDVLNLDALFDSLPVPAALRAARVSVAPPVGGSVEVSIDTNGIGGPDLTIVTINLSNPADQITVGQDIVVGT
jgi:Ca2+-binding RTX toxin-like protein